MSRLSSHKPIVRLHLSGFIFTPKLIPTLTFMMVFPILIGLGIWQLNRASYKQQVLVKLEQRGNKKPLTWQMLNQPTTRIQYRRVVLTGYYDNRHQVLLDNQVANHRVGYQVLTPFISPSSNKMVLVNRGFIPRLSDRRHLPKIKPVLGLQTISGMIKQPPKKVFVLKETSDSTHWPLLMQALRLKKITRALNQPLYPFIILLSPKANHGFLRQWTNTTTSVTKHRGYAIQWFALALTLVIIYIVVNTRRGSHESPRKS